jgi:hypothetical protein
MAVMPAPRETWTDERLGDLNQRVGEGFREQREDTRAVRTEIQTLRSETNARFDSMQRLILQVGAGLFGTMLIGFLGLAATLLTTQH